MLLELPHRDEPALPEGAGLTTVDIVESPSKELFSEYVRRSRPVIVRGAADAWPIERWSLDALVRAYGDRRLPIAKVSGGNVVFGPERGIDYGDTTLADYVRAIREEHVPSGYMAFPIAESLPELARDVRLPPFVPETRWTQTRLWLSPAGVGSPMHHDLPDNLYTQIVGKKRFILVPPRDSFRMYRQPLTSRLPQYSRVDAERPDHRRFPRFAKAKKIVIELAAGEVLYLPRLWWHQVRSLEASLSVNQWWAQGWVDVAVRAAVLYQRLRGLRW